MDKDIDQKRIRPTRRRKPQSQPALTLLGRLYINDLVVLYRLSRSTIQKHLRLKLIPEPDGIIAGRRYWKTSTIREDLEK